MCICVCVCVLEGGLEVYEHLKCLEVDVFSLWILLFFAPSHPLFAHVLFFHSTQLIALMIVIVWLIVNRRKSAGIKLQTLSDNMAARAEGEESEDRRYLAQRVGCRIVLLYEKKRDGEEGFEP